jgi:16S rRNA (guanine966-N2)-methyltransferase
MRIIAGTARGRSIQAPAGRNTRPTLDRVRENLFNMLQTQIYGAAVLDLFAGSGALSLEALSRGARRAIIADSGRSAIEAIRRNAQSVLKDEMDERVQILKMDYRSVISGLKDRKFDLVFLDPPYRMLDAYADAIERLAAQDALGDEVIIVCERRFDAVIRVPEDFEIYDTRS